MILITSQHHCTVCHTHDQAMLLLPAGAHPSLAVHRQQRPATSDFAAVSAASCSGSMRDSARCVQSAKTAWVMRVCSSAIVHLYAASVVHSTSLVMYAILCEATTGYLHTIH